MKTTVEKAFMPADLRLAAIVALLSSSALSGVTPAKAAALQAHLQAARLEGECLDGRLREVLDQVLSNWSAQPFSGLAFSDQAVFVQQSNLLH